MKSWLPLLLSLHLPMSVARAADEPIKLNQVQFIGTHNSYHAGMAASESRLLQERNPTLSESLDYRHAALDQQLSGGVRQIELDIYADSTGGRYAHPLGIDAVAAAGLPRDAEFDPQGLMARPGFKVLHVQELDYRSNCPTLLLCLQRVRAWSQAHPHHLPVFILLETKQSELPPQYHAPPPEQFTAASFDALDAEIRAVFSPAQMITPDEVRGAHQTLEESVRHGGWPRLSASRGKVVFLMDQRAVGPLYLAGHPSLQGRLIFTNAEPGQADCAFTEENEGSKATIDALVRQGYLVRTRTDADTKQARINDTTRRDIAMSSGAQLLSTDYPASEPSPWTPYVVKFQDGAVARCNPVNAPLTCNGKLLLE